MRDEPLVVRQQVLLRPSAGSFCCSRWIPVEHFANWAAQNVAWTQQTLKGIQSVKLVISNQQDVLFHITWTCINSYVRTRFAAQNTSSYTEAILTKCLALNDVKAVYLQRQLSKMPSYCLYRNASVLCDKHPTACLWNARVSNPWIWSSEVKTLGEVGLRVDIPSVLNNTRECVCIPLTFVLWNLYLSKAWN
jgi:hypothetical protein